MVGLHSQFGSGVYRAISTRHLALSYRPGWRRLFEKLGGFFSTTFGKDWQKKEKAFWEEVTSGKYEQKPVILKK